MQDSILLNKSLPELFELLKLSYQRQTDDTVIVLVDTIISRLINLNGTHTVSEQRQLSQMAVILKLSILSLANGIEILGHEPAILTPSDEYWHLFDLNYLVQLHTEYIAKSDVDWTAQLSDVANQVSDQKCWHHDQTLMSHWLLINDQVVDAVNTNPAINDYYHYQFQLAMAMFNDRKELHMAYQNVTMLWFNYSMKHEDQFQFSDPVDGDQMKVWLLKYAFKLLDRY